MADEESKPRKAGPKKDLQLWFRNRWIPDNARDIYLYGSNATGKAPGLTLIARHLDVSHDYLKNLSRTEGWKVQREELQKRLRKAKENSAARLLEQQMDMEQRTVHMATALLDRLQGAVEDKNLKFTDLTVDKLVAAFDMLNRLIRRNIGLPERSSDARAKKAFVNQYNKKIVREFSKIITDPDLMRLVAAALAKIEREMVGEMADIELESQFALTAKPSAMPADGPAEDEKQEEEVDILPPPVDVDESEEDEEEEPEE